MSSAGILTEHAIEVLTLNVQIKIVADNSLNFFGLFFSEKIKLDDSWEKC